MSRRAGRTVAFGISAIALAVVVGWGIAGLPRFGEFHGAYGRLLDKVAVQERHATNVVGATVFDYRSLDTLGEEFILFTSVMGLALLLRSAREIEQQRPFDVVSNEPHRVVGLLVVPAAALLGIWLVAFGYITPGGGFQGGVAIACAIVLIWAAGSYRDLRALTPTPVVDAFEALGAGGFAVVGLVALGLGSAYLTNFIGLGTTGTLYAAGTIAVLNMLVGVEVAAANVLIYHEFLEEYIQTFEGVEAA